MNLKIDLEDFQVWEDETIASAVKRVIQNEIEFFVKREMKTILLREKEKIIKALSGATISDINKIVKLLEKT
jgi:hypothetical protein